MGVGMGVGVYQIGWNCAVHKSEGPHQVVFVQLQN